MSMSSFVPPTEQTKEELEAKAAAEVAQAATIEETQKKTEEVTQQVQAAAKAELTFQQWKDAYYQDIKPAIETKYADKKEDVKDAKEVEGKKKEVDKIPAWRKQQMADTEIAIAAIEKSKLAEEERAKRLLGRLAQIHKEIYDSYWIKFRVKNSVMYTSIDKYTKDIPAKTLEAAISSYQSFADSPVYKQENARVQADQLNAANLFLQQGRTSFHKKMERYARRHETENDPIAKNQVYKQNVEAIKDKNGKTSYRDIEDEAHYPDFKRVSYFKLPSLSIFNRAAPAPEPKKEEQAQVEHVKKHGRRR